MNLTNHLVAPQSTLKKIAATLCAGSLAVISACGSGESSDSSVNQDPIPEGTTAQQLVLDDEATPDGFTFLEVGESERESMTSAMGDYRDGNVNVDPAQCEGVAIDSLSFLQWMYEPEETLGLANYGMDASDVDGIQIMLQTDPADEDKYPDELSECEETVKTSGTGQDILAKTFKVTPADLTVDGADVKVAARVAVTGVEYRGEDKDMEGEDLLVLVASLRGVTFTIGAPASLSEEGISELANQQVRRIDEA